MFEGLVRQLLLGYLGRYIKDIHRDQLKITVWNEEVLLENVELILEAFDYLQLPVALKQGRVGRLSIKIPWKKLGWEPIIITVEDVFICASQRDEQEWGVDAIERREFAGKKAKLAAAELAKLSRRVCDSQAGNPFMSFVAAKILDSIQVSIRNFHVSYGDVQPGSVQVILGLRFSSLTVTKQNSVGSSTAKLKGGQVNKLVEVEALEIYCDTYEGAIDLMSCDNQGGSNFWCDSRMQSDKFGYLLKPFNVSVTLLVNRSGEVCDDLPLYSISAKLTDLAMILNEFQLQQILILVDYLQTSELREKYGRYRPWCCSVSRKPDGWQKLWWRYAQESVLSDVRKKLKRTSWRFLGQRVSNRRKYINLYKIKLAFLLKEQPVDESILLELEQIEKESDINDILTYRSVAEREMQEALSESTTTIETHGVIASVEKPRSDDWSSSRSLRWLNWLSRGMLGAGGTDDSGQFSGVVSDEVVKDIHEATKFHPLSSPPRNLSASDKIYTCAIRFNIQKISVALQNVHSCQVITELDLLGGLVECKLWEVLTAMSVSFNSGRLVYPQTGKEILTLKGASSGNDAVETQLTYRARVDVSHEHDFESSVKVILQPLEVTYDMDFFQAVFEFFSPFKSFRLQRDRVLTSLNGLEDVKTRMIAKAEYFLSSRSKVKWDVNIINLIINFLGQNADSGNCRMVFELGSLCFASKCNTASVSSSHGEETYMVNGLQNYAPSSSELQIKELYNQFEFQLNDFEMKLIKVHPLQVFHVFQKLSATVNLASCIVPDESVLKQLEVNATVSAINVHVSPSIYQSVLSMTELFDNQRSRSHSVMSNPVSVYYFTINANLELIKLHVNLGNDGENSTFLILSLQELDIRSSHIEFVECMICTKALELVACRLGCVADSHILCSSGNVSASNSTHPQEIGVRLSDQINSNNHITSSEAFIHLHYKAWRSINVVRHQYTLYWRDADLHCYPYIFGLLAGFYDRISSYKTSSTDNNCHNPTADSNNSKTMPEFQFKRFGYSNFFETGSSRCGCIPLDSYPFLTIYNSGSLGSLESSLSYSIPNWRKLFNLRDTKSNGECSSKLESEGFNASPIKDSCSLDAFSLSEGHGDANLYMVEIHLSSISVHFHDSSCIFGTIVLPKCKSSLVISDDLMDMVCSAEGLMLRSSLWTTYLNDFLWGPSLPNLSPVFNLRMRKGNSESCISKLEVSIGIQHVRCILPSEYLAIIIGYFSLPDWTSKSSPLSISQASDTHCESVITYKFEVLDSVLIMPVGSDGLHHFKIDIQQLYSSYIPESASSNVMQGMPRECEVPINKIAERNTCLNIFGRDLSLLFLSKNGGYGGLTLEEHNGYRNITLAAPLSADVWVRIPCEINMSSASTCILTRIETCQVLVDDAEAFEGFQALLDVIDQFSLVDEESKLFTSDVSQFMISKSRLKEDGAVLPLESFTSFMEIRCYANSFAMKLHRLRRDSALLERVVQADMTFSCSASLVNDLPVSLDVSFLKFEFSSLLNSVLLARCNTLGGSSVLDVRFTNMNQHESELCFSLPSLDIWLHSFDWTEVFEIYESYTQKLAIAAQVDSLSKGSTTNAVDTTESEVNNGSDNAAQASNFPEKGVYGKETTVFAAKSKSIGVTIHFPVCISDMAFTMLEAAEVLEEDSQTGPPNAVDGKSCKYVTVAARSQSSELFVIGGNVRMNSILEKLDGTIAICEGERVDSWTLFRISQIHLGIEILNNLSNIVHANVAVLSDYVEMCISHQVLVFWHGVALDFPEAGSSKSRHGNMEIEVQISDLSLLISDGRWSCSGPLFEVLMRNIILQANATETSAESSITCNLEVNYNNIHKVLWEPFLEPWNFEIKITRNSGINALLNSSAVTEIILASSAQLNVNITESFVECIFRTIEMVKNGLGMTGPDDFLERKGLLKSHSLNPYGEQYAPFVLQNLTSLPLVYHVYQSLSSDVHVSSMVEKNYVESGSSAPIFLTDAPDEQLFYHKPDQSYDSSTRKQSNGVVHHSMTIQLGGTSVPSAPCSMDRVGLTYFEVDLFKASNYSTDVDGNGKADFGDSFIVPVVFDVSLQRSGKLIRVYSTVIISNATSVPLELRFDIPFGVSPKILDPIFPDQEFPLPLHLAEAGRMRWRPLGDYYLWSEAHSISKLLSQESKTGFLRSFACYPSHPSSEPFRCCISVQSINLPTSGPSRVSSFHFNDLSDGNRSKNLHELDQSNKRFIHQVTLSTPLVVSNCLPDPVSLTIESGGITQHAPLSEVETPFHHIDPSHDLALEFKLHGFGSLVLKFPRSDTFSRVAKFSGAKFSETETLRLDPELGRGSLHVTFEKTMDVISGAREVFVFVPFLLYNCTTSPLVISDCTNELKGTYSTIPSCYDSIEQQFIQNLKDGLGIFSNNKDSRGQAPNIDVSGDSSTSQHIILTRRNGISHMEKVLGEPVISSTHRINSHKQPKTHCSADLKDPLGGPENSLHSKTSKDICFLDNGHGKVKACVYSPYPISSGIEIMARIQRGLPGPNPKNVLNSVWSAPFPLVPPSGSTCVVVPQSLSSTALMLSVNCCALTGAFSGRTQAITFQPRYVICNSCSKDLCYKQKGTNLIFHLGIGQHSHLHWTDNTRELLVSVRFNDPGWQWSGSFLPDHLGDTQLKMRNYISGALNIVRVEVQNADISGGDEKIVGNLHGNAGTSLILLSDDDTGYMPYRIDNFSKERLRVYQQKCETFDTIVHPYSSCPYAWDEPCYTHRLTIEVPGDRVIGSYALDDIKELVPVQLHATSERPERTLRLTVYAEGATKVLSIIDSSYHILKDTKDRFASEFQKKGKQKLPKDKVTSYTEKFSLVLPSVGISVINSDPQELVFACATDIVIDLIQSVNQQKLSFQISSLQIDNQLAATSFPVILSFYHEHRRKPPALRTNDSTAKSIDEIVQQVLTNIHEPVFYLSIAKWRKKDASLVSFEYINLRVADFCLELELETVLSLLEFIKSVLPNTQSRLLPLSDPKLHPLIYDMGSVKDTSTKENPLYARNIPVFNEGLRDISLPSIVPIGAPWQQIHLLARQYRKIFIEMFELAPVNFILSFSSAPWMLRNGLLGSGESLIHRGFMALADVEGARIHLKQLTIAHHMTSWESFQDILIGHYNRQLLHEIYKVFGSAGVIGNPLGFARNVGLGIKDFLSAPARSISKSPTGLIRGMAQGTTSLLSNTVYALSDAATQFSKAAHKGIVAFTFNDHDVARMEKQQKGEGSHSKGVINEVFEGLTGLLQSPIMEAEKHGLPGVLSGIALGVTGLVARPAASILEVTGKTAQSIRNRSRLHNSRSQHYRVRLPRPLGRELPLRPYSWEEAVGMSVLKEAADLKFKDEVLVMCKALKQPGKFVLVTGKLVLIVSCPDLVDFGQSEFQGVAVEPEWLIETEIGLDNVIHTDTSDGVIHIVGSSSVTVCSRKQNQPKKSGATSSKRWNDPASTVLPLFQTNIDLPTKEDAESLLQVLLSTIDTGKARGWGSQHLLHKSNIR